MNGTRAMKGLLTFLLTVGILVTEIDLKILYASAQAVSGSAYDYDVSVDVESAEEAAAMVSVSIEWDDLTFVYKESLQERWDAKTHSYIPIEDAEESGWEKTSGNIIVTSHSNIPLTVYTFFGDRSAMSLSSTKNGVTAQLNQLSHMLPSAEGTTVENAPSAVCTVSISGTPITMQSFEIDTIHVWLE